MRKQTSVFEAVLIIITPGVSHFIHKIKKITSMQHTKSGCGRCCFLCFPDKRPAPVPLMLRKTPPTISVLLHNCNQQRNLRGELERGVRNPVINCFPKRDIFFSISYKNLTLLEHTGDCMNTTML